MKEGVQMNKNDLLKKALKEVYEEKDTFDLHNESDLEWEFTEKYHFESKMNKLLKSHKQSHRIHFNSASKRIIAIIAAIIFMLSSAMCVPAVRKPIIDFIIERYEKYSLYRVDNETIKYAEENTPNKIVTKYFPTAIPSDFVELDYYSDENSLFYIWKNSNEQTIEFYQKTITTQTNINTEDTTLIETEINEKPIYTYTRDGMSSYLWYDNGYYFILNVPDMFTIDKISNIIESIEPNNN